ncbi:MAG TPA: PDZ domain-containing protein [Lacipirellulaceae bacterium]|jgi:hypothetical protein|nr:PDZ domain-containing protein [Lacipirellulaceae bacterium]
MKIAEHFALYLLSLAVGMIAETGQPGVTNDNQSLSPPAQSTQLTDTKNAPVANLNSPAATTDSAANQGPPQRLYENSAAMGSRPGMPAPDMLQNRAMSANGQQSTDNNSQMNGANQRHGELGVWLIETGRQGVRIGRINAGSAADRAGLKAGDVILQVNGQDTSSPSTAARIVRSIPIGQTATLTIWRDGKQQDMQVAMEPARSSYQVGYRGDNNSEVANGQSGDLSSRTMRLEQEVESMTEELRQMRQEMMSLRGAGSATPAANSTQPGTGIGTSTPAATPMPSTSRSSDLTPPQAGAGSATPTTPAAAAPSSSTAPAPSSTGAAPSTGGTPNNSQDIFGTGTAPSNTPPANSGSSSSSGTETK